MDASGRIRVGLIDDHPLFREGLAALLATDPGLTVVGQVGDVVEARALLARDLDLAIVDVLMPGTSGITIANEIRDRGPRCKILVLSAVDEPCLIADMFRAGASGFVLKTQPIAEIREAIRSVIGGGRYLPPNVSPEVIEAEQLAIAERRLTRREREIFELVIRGFGNSDIASQLGIALRTVETHRQRVMKKLPSRSVAELQRYVARHGGL